MPSSSAFHSGELAAQKRAGAGDVASWASDFIRDHMPQQHRDFHTSLPFLVMSAADDDGQVWVTLLEGEDGFATAPDDRTLLFDTVPHPSDPLAQAMASGADIGMLGIELATRRRNRLSGHIKAQNGQLALNIRQTFGNCPQYIREREWHRVADHVPGKVTTSPRLSQDQIARIRAADTLFIGSGQQGQAGAPSNGYDASHRGGDAGFVHVVDDQHLSIPDYAGNNFFNTIGNLIEDPRVGLVFIDFETGGLLHLTGTATIDWDPVNPHDPAARRMINIAVEKVIDRSNAVSLRWQSGAVPKRALRIAEKRVETPEITSLHLVPAERIPLATFKAGQHLPVELSIPGKSAKVARSYSLSNAPGDAFYRLSIKREAKGLVSRHIHDALNIGDIIEAGRPSGDFVVPCSACPLVLISAGVGITPMLSMLHAAALGPQERPVWFVHGARNSDHHALRSEVDALIGAHGNFHRSIHYSQPLASDRQGADYDSKGRITPGKLIALNAGPDAHYLLCGPAPFLASIRVGLRQSGIADDQIHFETFGPSS